MGILLPAWKWRHFIIGSIKNEFLTRFARSRLGGLWMVLHPLAQVAIYALVLSTVLAAKLPGIDNRYAYAIYLMAGMLAWSLFSEVLGRSLNIFIENANLLKKIAFPKIALPIIALGSALLNNLFLLAAILMVFGLLGHLPTWNILWLPLLIMLTLGLAVGLGLALGIVNVFIRDVGQVIPIILQFAFWLTPVVYTADILPETYRRCIVINPMTGIVTSYQNILAFNRAPDLSALVYPGILATGAVILALFLYRRASEEMTDAL
jgi:lipopolysaccharide transport system permease protein